MTAFINALREEGTKEDCLAAVERLWNERNKAEAEARTLRNLAITADEARNKALDEARMAVSLALSMYSCTCHHAAKEALLALKEPKP